jgi:hypothetical protein
MRSIALDALLDVAWNPTTEYCESGVEKAVDPGNSVIIAPNCLLVGSENQLERPAYFRNQGGYPFRSLANFSSQMIFESLRAKAGLGSRVCKPPVLPDTQGEGHSGQRHCFELSPVSAPATAAIVALG